MIRSCILDSNLSQPAKVATIWQQLTETDKFANCIHSRAVSGENIA